MARMLRTVLPTAGLLVALTTGEGLAGPRTTPAPPSTLSHTELVCQAYGTFAWSRALDRDNGYSLVTVLEMSRRYDRQHQVGPAVEADHDDIIRGVYAAPLLSPTRARQAVESLCLQTAQPLAPARPRSGAGLRY